MLQCQWGNTSTHKPMIIVYICLDTSGLKAIIPAFYSHKVKKQKKKHNSKMYFKRSLLLCVLCIVCTLPEVWL